MRSLAIITLPVVALMVAGCVRATPSSKTASIETAEAQSESMPAADDIVLTGAEAEEDKVTKVKVTTDGGSFIIDVHEGWAPIGAKHWLKLVKMGYYDDTRIFRAIDGFMAQSGISGDPAMTAKYGEDTIMDDEVRASNKRGYVTFAQTGAPNSRSTQWFINFGDNSFLDNSGQGFMPFGKVTEGMSTVDKIYTGYGENNPGDNVQGNAESKGNAFLDDKFPNLTKIIKIEILEDEPEAPGDKPKAAERPQG